MLLYIGVWHATVHRGCGMLLYIGVWHATVHRGVACYCT